jgi:hypothetical protein
MSSGSFVSSASSSPCGIEKGLWLKVDLPVSSSPRTSGSRRSSRSGKRPSRSGRARRRRGCAPGRRASAASASLPAAKNTAVVGAEAAARRGAAPCRRSPWFLAIGPPEFAALAGDIAEAGGPRRAPSRSCRRRTCGSSRRCPAPGWRAPRRPSRRSSWRTGRSRSREVLGDVGDDERVAQVRLVGAVFQHRLAIGDAREFGAGSRPRCRSARTSSNTPASTGSIAANTSSCVTKLISKSSW